MRNLDQNTSAVSCLRIATAGTTMGEVNEYLNTFSYHIMRLMAVNVGNKAQAASVMFVTGVI